METLRRADHGDWPASRPRSRIERKLAAMPAHSKPVLPASRPCGLAINPLLAIWWIWRGRTAIRSTKIALLVAIEQAEHVSDGFAISGWREIRVERTVRLNMGAGFRMPAPRAAVRDGRKSGCGRGQSALKRFNSHNTFVRRPGAGGRDWTRSSGASLSGACMNLSSRSTREVDAGKLMPARRSGCAGGEDEIRTHDRVSPIRP